MPSSKPVAAPQLGPSRGWGARQDSRVRPPVLVSFCRFSPKRDIAARAQLRGSGNPVARGSPQRALAARSASCVRAAHGSGRSVGHSAHGPAWIGPFVFFRLFLWLSRSFWILSLPAGYLQSLVAFHYINKFTVYYLVAARPGPRSVLCPVYASGGSWLLFSFSLLTNANKLLNTNYGHHHNGIKVLYPGIASFLCCMIVTVPSQAFKIWHCAALCMHVWLKGWEFCV